MPVPEKFFVKKGSGGENLLFTRGLSPGMPAFLQWRHLASLAARCFVQPVGPAAAYLDEPVLRQPGAVIQDEGRTAQGVELYVPHLSLIHI